MLSGDSRDPKAIDRQLRALERLFRFGSAVAAPVS
jgi:hypothetical protein